MQERLCTGYTLQVKGVNIVMLTISTHASIFGHYSRRGHLRNLQSFSPTLICYQNETLQ